MICEKTINFDKLRKSEIPLDFVKKYNGVWNHKQWQKFCEQITDAGYYPIELNKVGILLEELKRNYF